MTAQSAPRQPRNLAARVGRWSAEHRWLAIAGWLAFVAVAFVIGQAVGTKDLSSTDTGAGESQRAARVLDKAGFDTPAGEVVLIQTKTGSATDPAFTAAVEEVIAKVSAVPVVANVRSPLDNPDQVSEDGRSALVQFEITGEFDDAADKVEPVLAAVDEAAKAHPELIVEQFGDASATKALDDTIGEDFKQAEFASIPVTLIILLIAFGALVAAGLPLLLGLTSVLAALGLLAVVSQAIPADEAANSVILLIGLAVGVDYSLFYIKREREERARGLTKEASLNAAAATSGRSVLISGLTVLVAMAGMYFTGNAVFSSIATGTIMVVAISVIGSLTVLPAMLSLLGDRVNKGRIPFVHRALSRRASADGGSRFWGWTLQHVLRHPVISVVVAGGALIALTIPTLGLHTSLPGFSSLPQSLPIVQTYDRIQTAFPGGPQPAIVVVSAADVTAPAVTSAIDELKEQALASGQMFNPIQVDVNPAKTVARVAIPLAGDGTNDASNAALATLRGKVIPATLKQVDGTTAYVTGVTAGSKDFNDKLKERAPLVFGFVLLFAFVLLLVAFRSIVIALKSILLNLLSVGSAYGILVLVFQHTWAESILDFKSTGGIVSWLPLFLFVVLFGLSMDYHVFILSRVREAFDRGLKTDEAVASGIRATAGVVTSAAVVMVAVFAIFATLSTVEMKQLGIGLSVAVFLDATLVRAVLLPATMKLLGEWNWYLPKWLEWLPKWEIEGATGETRR